MYARGIRGATTVQRNDADEIRRETTVLLEHIVAENQMVPEDIVSIWITMTQDLNASFPAQAIRAMPGWEWVPLMCAVEVPVAGSLPLCIRLMVTVNTDKSQREMRHVYLNEASQLRPDLSTS